VAILRRGESLRLEGVKGGENLLRNFLLNGKIP